MYKLNCVRFMMYIFLSHEIIYGIIYNIIGDIVSSMEFGCYFDEKKKLLDAENKRKLFKYLDSIDFIKWTTDETTIVNIEIGAYGFCVNESFSCVFEDDTTFYCATPPRRQFKKMVKFFKKFFVGENYSKWHS